MTNFKLDTDADGIATITWDAPERSMNVIDIATIQQQEMAYAFRFHISQYLMRRSADWKAKGFAETLADWASLNARSKFWGDDQRAAFKNWEEVTDMRNPHGARQGVNERIMLRELLRRVDMMVIIENRLDALVRLHTPFPPAKIGGAPQPRTAVPGPPGGKDQNLLPESFNGPNAGFRRTCAMPIARTPRDMQETRCPSDC